MQIRSDTSLLSTLGQLTGLAGTSSPIKASSPVAAARQSGQQAVAAADAKPVQSGAASARSPRGSIINMVV